MVVSSCKSGEMLESFISTIELWVKEESKGSSKMVLTKSIEKGIIISLKNVNIRKSFINIVFDIDNSGNRFDLYYGSAIVLEGKTIDHEFLCQILKATGLEKYAEKQWLTGSGKLLRADGRLVLANGQEITGSRQNMCYYFRRSVVKEL